MPAANDPEVTAIEALRQELAAANALLVGLGGELSAARVETAVRVEGLRAEQNRERRRRMMAVAGGTVAIVYVTDEHVQHCSPGSRTAAVFNASERGVTSATALKKIYDHTGDTMWCDAPFPLHSHSAEHFPTTGNVVGYCVLAAATVLTYMYHRWRTRRDFARVEDAARMEERHAPTGKSV